MRPRGASNALPTPFWRWPRTGGSRRVNLLKWLGISAGNLSANKFIVLDCGYGIRVGSRRMGRRAAFNFRKRTKTRHERSDENLAEARRLRPRRFRPRRYRRRGDAWQQRPDGVAHLLLQGLAPGLSGRRRQESVVRAGDRRLRSEERHAAGPDHPGRRCGVEGAGPAWGGRA